MFKVTDRVNYTKEGLGSLPAGGIVTHVWPDSLLESPDAQKAKLARWATPEKKVCTVQWPEAEEMSILADYLQLA